jgi:hypothetical protein
MGFFDCFSRCSSACSGASKKRDSSLDFGLQKSGFSHHDFDGEWQGAADLLEKAFPAVSRVYGLAGVVFASRSISAGY